MKLTTIAAIGLCAAAATTTVRAGDAAANWNADCMQCHGKTGAADSKMGQKLGAKDFTDPKVQASFTDADAAKAIKEGIKDGGKTKMKAFGDKLSDDEIKALVAYVRGLKK
ncbi:MAG TPA: c-type cytochrome [Chthoniobacterales bacterium]|jgi:mono/diheme cytochrome c family protein